MKQLLIFLVFSTILFFSCNKVQEGKPTENNFKVSCKTTFKPKGTVKLFEVIAGNQKLIDSIKLEGLVDTFSFAGRQDIGGFYVLETARGQECLFALDTQKLTITIDGSLETPFFTASSTKINNYYYKIIK